MIERELPSDIFLDTSTVVAAIVPGTANARASADFCERLVVQRSRIFYSRLLRLEFVEAMRRLATRLDELPAELRRQYGLDDWERSLLVRRRWLESGVVQLEAFLGRFAEALEFPVNQRLWLRSVSIMAEHRLRSYDAFHVATAREARLSHLVTTDRHFRRVHDLTIWLTLDAPSDGSGR